MNEEVKGVKRKRVIQSVRLCEVTVLKKKDEVDEIMAEEEKRQIATGLEERSFNVQELTNNQLDIMN